MKFNEKYRWDIVCCGRSVMEKANGLRDSTGNVGGTSYVAGGVECGKCFVWLPVVCGSSIPSLL